MNPTDAGLEPVSLPGSDGLNLRADVAGPVDGAPVLLLHGGGQTRHSWHHSLNALAVRGWRAYSVDLRGHGESDWAKDGNYRLEAFAEDLRCIVRSLGRPAVFIGASLGGMSSLMAIGESKENLATGLVLVDIAPRIETAGTDRVQSFMRANAEHGFATLEEVADAIAAYNPHRPRPKDLSGLTKNLRKRADGRWVWHWDPRFLMAAPGGHDETRLEAVQPERLERAAQALKVPVLLVRGHLSDLVSVEGAQAFLKLVPGSELVDVGGAGHMIAGDRNDAFNDAIVEFLTRRIAHGQ